MEAGRIGFSMGCRGSEMTVKTTWKEHVSSGYIQPSLGQIEAIETTICFEEYER
jgi:hypothetical protein